MRYKKKGTSDDAWVAYVDGTKTVEEVAEHFDVAISTAHVRASMLKLKFKKEDKIFYPGLEDYAKEHTMPECISKYNSNYNTIRSYMFNHHITCKKMPSKNGLECRVTKHTGTTDAMIAVLCEHFSYDSIAKVFGYSKETIRLKRKKFLEEQND